MNAEAHVETEQASRYLLEVCGQLAERARANPEMGVRVRRSEAGAVIDLGWGRCVLCADAGTLSLRAEAEDGEALAQIRELLSRHVEDLAGGAGVTWWQDGRPITNTHADRRDAMRGFHRRMRG